MSIMVKDDFLHFPGFFGHLRNGDERIDVETGCRLQLTNVNIQVQVQVMVGGIAFATAPP